MSNELIERLAREAGMTDLCAGMRFRSGDDPAVSDVHLARFAALVAERCAQRVDHILAEGGGTQGDAIRAAFPMPKDRAMRWSHDLPSEGGFYYYQPPALRAAFGDLAVVVVQVSKYRNREGFAASTLHETRWGSVKEAPPYSGDLDQMPRGRWAGPLPQPRD